MTLDVVITTIGHLPKVTIYASAAGWLPILGTNFESGCVVDGP